MGGDGRTIALRNETGQDSIVLNGSGGNGQIGGNGSDGALSLKNAANLTTILFHAGGGTVELNDIMLKNADCAEDFEISRVGTEEVEPGTVMVLNPRGAIQPSEQSYDKKVVGVISGAGDYKPALVLDKDPSRTNRMPLALLGKVYCKVDADYGPIEVGDLLTTSPTRGYAMKAADPSSAFGCVIGKALRPLETGQALIPVLIALQ